MNTRTKIQDTIRYNLAEQLGLDVNQLDNSQTFADLGADSLDCVELVMVTEDVFGFEITDDDADRFFNFNNSIQHVTDYVVGRLNAVPATLPATLPAKSNMSLANIKLASFDYTKDDGSRSARSVVVVDESPDRVLGLEVKNGDLTAVQPYLAYTAELAEITLHLKAKYGLNDKTKPLPYKSFKQAGINARNDVDLTIDL